MNENESPNYAEFLYSKKSEGGVLLKRAGMICLYILFVLGAFILCVQSGFVPVFAVVPLLLYILVLCTWRLVKYDCYVEFKLGTLELGKIKINKFGRRRFPKIAITVRDAESIFPFKDKTLLEGVKRVYDYSESQSSDKRICIIFEKSGERSAAIFEGTARIASLLSAFCKNTHGIKNERFHG